MNALSSTLSPPANAGVNAGTAARGIVLRTHGHRHGPITRLMSPSDLGQLLKPFVFLDLIDADAASMRGFGLHPHSGIATLTWLIEGSVRYEDTTGKEGVLPQGGVEWMQAGGGVWHGGGPHDGGRLRGFQLWVALPPALELGPAESIYLAPAAVPQVGPARVLLGRYGSAESELPAPAAMNYLAVRLKAGERWRYQPPSGHRVGWVAINTGALRVPEALRAGELAVFEEAETAIDFHAETDTDFVLGSAVKHPHELVLGTYSVHTDAAALRAGEAGIQRIRARLHAAGRLG